MLNLWVGELIPAQYLGKIEGFGCVCVDKNVADHEKVGADG
jgi:hypothetical protein